MNTATPTLATLREEIDAIDDGLVDLLLRRAALVGDIAAAKKDSGSHILHPGREASILRRCLERSRGRLEAETVVRIFREIVSSSLRQQMDLSVAVCQRNGDPGCLVLARDHFGAGSRMACHSGPSEVIRAVHGGTAMLGVVPLPIAGEEDPWWPRLMQADAPRILARLPMLDGASLPSGETGGALVLGRQAPEPSGDEAGDDTSFLALSGAFSRSRLDAALAEAGFDPRGVIVAPPAGDHATLWLTELVGFHHPEPSASRLADVLGVDTNAVFVLGAAAAPWGFSPSGGAGWPGGTG